MLGWAEVEFSSWMIVNKLRPKLAMRADAIEVLEKSRRKYAGLDPDLRSAIGAQDFPARPIPIIGGEQ
jgi:hypothetical protein